MKIVFPGINNVFDCNNKDYTWTLVIENQSLFYNILDDIIHQINGDDGKVVVSEDNKVLQTDKVIDVISQFVPFDINNRQIINKVVSRLSHVAVDGAHYEETMELLSMIEEYCMNLAFDLSGNIIFSKVDADSILKAVGVEFADDYTSLGEKLIDYFELVTEYDKVKLYLLINLRSYISDDEAENFIETVISRGYQVLMIESSEHPLLKYEKRYIVDANLCEIS